MRRLRLAILISGRGSNMRALLDAALQDAAYPAEPVLVLSNKPEAEGLSVAQTYGIKTASIDHRPFGKNRKAFEAVLHEHLLAVDTEIIALAGFMRILSPWFVHRWTGRMINIHPSLLPKYKGLDTHQRAIDAGEKEAGCSVHWVSEGVDTGTVIAQARSPIAPEETANTLAQKVLGLEHELYPKALKIACQQILGAGAATMPEAE